jgi:hypothetical protein
MQTPNDIRVTSWAQLNEEVFHNSWRQDLGRFRSSFAYRGLSDAAYELKTSLLRLGHTPSMTRRLEPVVLRNFRKYAHRDSSPSDSVWNWLSLAQHHGLPTRMLDWTNSPHVAMHFATSDPSKFDLDGVIWCVQQNIVRFQYLPKLLRDVLEREYAAVFNPEILNRIVDSLEAFEKLSDETFVIFMEPPALDDRIVNQYALFSLMSSPTTLMNEWLMDRPDTFRRIIIPAELKWEIRDKLDQMNITERILFPGLDGLSSWLKRYYTPRIPIEPETG